VLSSASLAGSTCGAATALFAGVLEAAVVGAEDGDTGALVPGTVGAVPEPPASLTVGAGDCGSGSSLVGRLIHRSVRPSL
jgi:hypothetical protein